MYKKFYVLCLLLFGFSAFAFELSEPIENALKTKQNEQIKTEEVVEKIETTDVRIEQDEKIATEENLEKKQ